MRSFAGATENAMREVAPWLAKLARLGFIANAVLYATIGTLATAAALRHGRTEPRSTPGGARGALAHLIDAPLGTVLLVVIAVGLFGYAIWRLVEGIHDPEQRGTSARGIFDRARDVLIGIIDIALSISAIKLVAGDLSAVKEGESSQHWAARALATPGGTIALWGFALGFVGYGLYQLYCAWRAKLDDQLSLAALSPRARRVVLAVCRFGIAARGIVFGTVGVLLMRGVQRRDPHEARGVKAAMLELFELGRIPFLIIAIGLVAYGVYQLVCARYRRIAVA